MPRYGKWVLAVVLAASSRNPALAADYRIGDCIGPVVTGIDAGAPRSGVLEHFNGSEPEIMSGPGPSARPTGRKLPTGGSYTVVGVSGRDIRLAASKFAPPFAPGSVVGWFRPEGFHALAPRNCP